MKNGTTRPRISGFFSESRLRSLLMCSIGLVLWGSAGVPANGTDDPRAPRQTQADVQQHKSSGDKRADAGSKPFTKRFPANGQLLPVDVSGETRLSLDNQPSPIDLATSLALAGYQNPQILVAMQRTVAASARQQLAAAQALPNINLGTNYDAHTGVLQQASGNILNVNRGAMYLGAGTNAVAAGSVGIPGVQYNLNVGESLYGYYELRQRHDASMHRVNADRNQVLMNVSVAYMQLVGAQAQRSAAFQARKESSEVATITAAYAKTGQGLPADAERAATELELREGELVRAEADVSVASARLAEVLGLDHSNRLYATDNYLVPHPTVPESISRSELLAIALIQRPELHEHQSLVHAALMSLKSAKLLPFSPQIMFGYSGGAFGGGSDLIASNTSINSAPTDQARFGNLGGRTDLDAVAFWSLRNLGVGNKAIIRAADARWRESDLQLLDTLNRVRQEVVDAQVRTHAFYKQINIRETAVRTATVARREDMVRIRSNEGLPIETLDSVRLLRQSRQDYIKTIVDYNKAHFELYTALGNPPANMVARPSEPVGVPE